MLSGKALEVTVKRVLMGDAPEKAASRESLANPDALDCFVALAADDDPGRSASTAERQSVARIARRVRADAADLTDADVRALRAIGRLVDEIGERARTDPAAADRLAEDLLGALLSPSGRGLLPAASETIARLLAGKLRTQAATLPVELAERTR